MSQGNELLRKWSVLEKEKKNYWEPQNMKIDINFIDMIFNTEKICLFRYKKLQTKNKKQKMSPM